MISKVEPIANCVGANPKKLTKDRRMNNRARNDDGFGYASQGKAIPGMLEVDNSGGRFKYLKGEEYRPKRNPLHFSDARMFEDKTGNELRGYMDRGGSRNVRASMDNPPSKDEALSDRD